MVFLSENWLCYLGLYTVLCSVNITLFLLLVCIVRTERDDKDAAAADDDTDDDDNNNNIYIAP